MERLKRNCLGFAREIDQEMLDVKFRDGECVFRLMIRQLRSLHLKPATTPRHWVTLSLGLPLSSEDADIMILRYFSLTFLALLPESSTS